MGKVSKFTDEQKFAIALDVIAGKLSHAEVCRKYDVSATDAYKLKDRALDILRQGIGRPPGKPDAEVEQLAGDHAPAIRPPKRLEATGRGGGDAGRSGCGRSPDGLCP